MVAHPAVHGPGLAVSRAFGDAVAHSCGVITVPEVRVRSIQPMTDGSWCLGWCVGCHVVADVGETIEHIVSKAQKARGSTLHKAIVSVARQRGE